MQTGREGYGRHLGAQGCTLKVVPLTLVACTSEAVQVTQTSLIAKDMVVPLMVDLLLAHP